MYSIRLDGDTRRLMKQLRHYSELDKRRVNRVLDQAVRESTLERFKTGVDPAGKAWETSKRAEAEGGKTLIDTGRLRNSIKGAADDTGFAVGTNVIYASSMQLGIKGRRVTIRAKTTKGLVFKVDGKWIRKRQVTVNIRVPARPFLGLSADDQKEIQSTINEFMEGD